MAFNLRETMPRETTPITVYSRQGCMACRATERELGRAGVDYRVLLLEEHPEVIEEARALGMSQAPVTVGPDGTMVAGYDVERIRSMVALASGQGGGVQASSPGVPDPAGPPEQTCSATAGRSL